MNSRVNKLIGPFRTAGLAAAWAEKNNFIVPWTITPLDTLGIKGFEGMKECTMTFDVRGDE